MINILSICHGNTENSRELAVFVGQNGPTHGNKGRGGITVLLTSEGTKKEPVVKALFCDWYLIIETVAILLQFVLLCN